jgi:hypothetical protein
MRTPFAVSLFLILAGAALSWADEPATDANLARRLEQLEAETRQLREQLQTIHQGQVPAPPSGEFQGTPLAVAGETAAPAPALAAPAPSPTPATPAGKEEFFSLEELRGEMQKLVWTKGDFRIVPYGILWANMVYETNRTQVGDFTFYVLPERPNTREQFHVDARSTRLGFDLTGPQVPLLNCATSGGKVEIDFQRLIDTENRAGVLLRHAYAEVKNEDFRLLAGQTWDVISPLYPGLLMYSVGWGGGNIGYRRAQFRGERYLDFSDVFLLTLQGSINQDIVSDIGSNFTGDHAGWPVLMGRIGATLGPRGPGCHPLDFGVSSHVGEQIFDIRTPFLNPVTGLARRTWSLNADVRWPITSRFGVQAEFFTGENLATFFGGVLQGVDIGTTATPGTRESIGSTGGWFDVWFDWTPRLHSHAGYSIDDPFNQDVTIGRNYNAFAFANLSYDMTAKFLVGLEMTAWKTIWVPQGPVDSVHLDFVAKYAF